MNKLFKKQFKKILFEETSSNASSDEEIFSKEFKNKEELEKLNNEIKNIELDPEYYAKIIKKADKYSYKITEYILPFLRKLHQDLISGIFKYIAPDIKGISNITEDLASLAEALRGRVRDSIIQKNKNKNK